MPDLRLALSRDCRICARFVRPLVLVLPPISAGSGASGCAPPPEQPSIPFREAVLGFHGQLVEGLDPRP